MSKLSNFTYDELFIGQTARYTKCIEQRDILLFAAVSGDVNPVHLDPEFAATTPFKEPIAHGMLTGAIISAAIALELPGPGSIYLSQSLRFHRPVKIGDTVTVELEISAKRDGKQFITLQCSAFNQHNKQVVSGTAEVKAPEQKLELERPATPDIEIRQSAAVSQAGTSSPACSTNWR
ncbi:MAG: MaoC family dehydratase [Halieaceae bacterium]|nr:MaoC family dehydratase [Halieaceae bacterium]